MVPVKPDAYEYEGCVPHAAWILMVPLPQQTGPAEELPQSSGERHCQSTDMATGQAVAVASHVESMLALFGGSQQCSVGWQMIDGVPLNGQ